MFLLCPRFIEKPFAFASVFSILFLVFIFEPPCLLNSCGVPPFLCPSPPSTILFLNIFKALSQTMETGDLGRGKRRVISDVLKGSLLSTS